MKFLPCLFVCALIAHFDLVAMERDEQNWKKENEDSEKKESKRGFRNYFTKLLKSSATSKKKEVKDRHRKNNSGLLRRSNSTLDFNEAGKIFSAILTNNLSSVEKCIKMGYLRSNLTEVHTHNTPHMVAFKNYFSKEDLFQALYKPDYAPIKKAKQILKKIFSPDLFAHFNASAKNTKQQTIAQMVFERNQSADHKLFKKLVAGLAFFAISQNADAKFKEFFIILADPNIIEKKTGNSLFMAAIQSWGQTVAASKLMKSLDSGEFLSPVGGNAELNQDLIELHQRECELRIDNAKKILSCMLAPKSIDKIDLILINKKKLSASDLVEKYNLEKGAKMLEQVKTSQGMAEISQANIEKMRNDPAEREIFYKLTHMDDQPKKVSRRRLSTQMSAEDLLNAALELEEKEETHAATISEYPVSKRNPFEQTEDQSKETHSKHEIKGRERKVSFVMPPRVAERAELAKKRAAAYNSTEDEEQKMPVVSESSFKSGSSSDDEVITSNRERRLSQVDRDPDNNNSRFGQ